MNDQDELELSQNLLKLNGIELRGESRVFAET